MSGDDTYWWVRREYLAALSPESEHTWWCRCKQCIDDLYDPGEDPE